LNFEYFSDQPCLPFTCIATNTPFVGNEISFSHHDLKQQQQQQQQQMEAAKQAPSPVFSATPAASSGNGLGVVSGSASGGRVLEKETISADTLDFLKSYNK